MALSDVRLIDLPRIRDPRGNLTFVENATHLPFDIARVYWLYDVPSDGCRDGHAFICQQELIVSLSGSFNVTVDDGTSSRTYTLNRPYAGLLVPALTWRTINNFSTNSAAMVLASTLYDPSDYLRDHDLFLRRVSQGPTASPSPAVPPHVSDRFDGIDAHAVSSVDSCRIIDLPRHSGPMGSLSVVENAGATPFDVRRVYYLYDVPSGAERGGHSHYREQRLITALAGAFDVTVDDGVHQRTFTLHNPSRALYIPAGIWRTVDNFSSGSVCLALSSNVYSAADYVRDYSRFLSLTSCKK